MLHKSTSNESVIKKKLTRFKYKKSAILVILLVLLFVFIVSTNNSKKDVSVNQNKPIARSDQNKLRIKSSDLIGKNKYAEAEKNLQDLVSQSSHEADYITLAGVQTSQYKNNDAKKTLLEASKKFGLDYIISISLAQNSISLKNNSQAIIYYKDALTSINNNPSQLANPKDAISNINAAINQLTNQKN